MTDPLIVQLDRLLDAGRDPEHRRREQIRCAQRLREDAGRPEHQTRRQAMLTAAAQLEATAGPPPLRAV